MADEDKSSGSQGGLKSIMDELPLDRLKGELQSGFSALSQKAMGSAGDAITGATGKLTDVTDNGGMVGKVAKGGAKEVAEGGSPVKGALKGGLSGAKDKVKDKVKDAIPGMSSGGGGGAAKATKAMNIAETIDVGVPVSVAYNQWTQYGDWPDFMKKLESAKQDDDEPTATFKGQVFWSHRSWEATIKEQVPDQRIVWRSTGDKGHVDGSVTFHELAPRLTRILVNLEYYPQGLFERTGNLWRAQGRRARLELKHFRRHVMMNTILEPEGEIEGWRGEIHDEEVTKTHDEVVEEEEQDDEEAQEGEESEDEYDEGDEPEDEESQDEDEDEGEEAEDEDEPEEEGEPEDEYEDEPEEESAEEPEEEEEAEAEPEEEDEPEEEEEEKETAPPRRRRRR